MIPEFMKPYYDGSNATGKSAIKNLARAYEEERRTFFETTFNEKKAFQRDWNKMTGDKKVLTQEEAIAPINYKYQEKAKEVAIANGYKEQAAQQVAQPPQPAVQPAPKNPKQQQFLDNLRTMRERQQQSSRPRQ